MASAFSSSFPVGGSFGRSSLNKIAGAKTTLVRGYHGSSCTGPSSAIVATIGITQRHSRSDSYLGGYEVDQAAGILSFDEK